jgi:alkyl hydroperoxide reductase subunit AhpC
MISLRRTSHSQLLPTQRGKLHGLFPLIVPCMDSDLTPYRLYDMLDAQDAGNIDTSGIAYTIRSVFIIDPSKKIRLTMSYPASTGRNTTEVLRVIDSLQTGDRQGVTTPINWTVGSDVIVPPSLSTEKAKDKFVDVKEVRPYLRFTSGEHK